jgi:hypothetical protein
LQVNNIFPVQPKNQLDLSALKADHIFVPVVTAFFDTPKANAQVCLLAPL